MTRLAVTDASALSEMHGRFQQSPRTVSETVSQLLTAGDHLMSVAAEEVRIRAAALAHCAPEERAYHQARLDRATEAVRIAQAIERAAGSLTTRVRASADEATSQASRHLLRLHAEVVAMPSAGAAAGAASAGIGAGAAVTGDGSGGALSTALPEGALAPDASDATYDALHEYSRMGVGQAFNNAARSGKLDPQQRELAGAIDRGFAGAAPLHADRQFHREVGLGFFDSLIGGTSNPDAIVSALNSGAAVRDDGYVSTSAAGGRFERRAIRLTVDVPSGTPVIDMTRERAGGGTIAEFTAEREFLLPRGGYLISVPGTASYDPGSGTYSLRVRYHLHRDGR